MTKFVTAILIFLVSVYSALAQRVITRYPDFTFDPATLSGEVSGLRTGTFTDLRPPSNVTDHVMRSIWWWERGDRPCEMSVFFEKITNSNEGSEALMSGCTSRSRQKKLEIRNPSLIKGGVGASLAACINRGRLKGLRVQMQELHGDKIAQPSTNPLFSIFNFVARTTTRTGTGRTVALKSDLGFDYANGVWNFNNLARHTVKRTNCGRNDWQEVASCNAGNISLDSLMTGLRVYTDTDGTIVGVSPWCSVVRVSESD